MKTILFKSYEAFNCGPQKDIRTDDAMAIQDVDKVKIFLNSERGDTVHIEIDGVYKIFITCRDIEIIDKGDVE